MEERTEILLEIVNRLRWRQAQNPLYPHAYVIKGKISETDWNLLAQAIADSPFYDFWKGTGYGNLYLGGYKYWRMGDILNRKPAMPPENGFNAGEANKKLREAQKGADS